MPTVGKHAAPQPGGKGGRRESGLQTSARHAESGSWKRSERQERSAARPLFIVCAIVLAVLVLCGIVCVVQALALEDLAQDAKGQIAQLQKDSEAAESTAAVSGNASAPVADAASSTSGAEILQTVTNLNATAEKMDGILHQPQWYVASMIPVLGHDISQVRTYATALHTCLDEVAVPLCEALSSGPLLQGGALNTEVARRVCSTLEQAAPDLQKCADLLGDTEEFKTELFQGKLGSFTDKLDGASEALEVAATLAPIADDLLGLNGTRRYLIEAQNTAEIRASGGFPGAAGILNIDGGVFDLEEFMTIYDMFEGAPLYTDVTETEALLFDLDRMAYPRDAGFDPDFPRVGQINAVVYNETFDDKINGVIAVAPCMLQSLLGIVGSITLSDGTVLDGTNATKYLQHDIYWKYLAHTSTEEGGNDRTDELFAEAAELAFDKLLDNLNVTTLLKLCTMSMQAVDERALMIYLVNEGEQACMEDIGCAGALNGDATQPQLGVFFTMNVASKMGWWLDIDTTIGKGTQNADGTTSYAVTTVLTNTMTAEECEAGDGYIVNGDGDLFPYIYFYAPAGGAITGFKASGNVSFAETMHEGLRVLFSKGGSIYPQESVTCTFTVTVSEQAQTELGLQQTLTLQEYR